MKITEEDLKNVFWNGIHVTTMDGVLVLVLVCNEVEQCVELFKMLRSNPFKLIIETNKEKQYRFLLQFIESDSEIFFQPNTNYAPLKQLAKGEVKNITTGFVNQQGKTMCNKETLELNSFNFSFN